MMGSRHVIGEFLEEEVVGDRRHGATDLVEVVQVLQRWGGGELDPV